MQSETAEKVKANGRKGRAKKKATTAPDGAGDTAERRRDVEARLRHAEILLSV